MFLDVLLATTFITLLSLIGAVFFSQSRLVVAIERYIVPAAVGVYMALLVTELLPNTFAAAPEVGGLLIGISFIGSYIAAHFIHQYLHTAAVVHSEKREAAILVLVGDSLHNVSDGVVIAGAFLISPEIGVVTTLAVALHELPQEIVEFGVLLRAGYTKSQAIVRNFLSASTVVIGGLLTVAFASVLDGSLWIITAIVAGNLLFVAATELLPRLHDASGKYKSFWHIVLAMLVGFATMASAIVFAHSFAPVHGHDHHDNHSDHKAEYTEAAENTPDHDHTD